MSATMAWLERIHAVLAGGEVVAPRGKRTLEVQHAMLEMDMNRPVVFVPERKLNFKFMAAEARWMLEGRDDVASLSKHNPHIAQFSDDGERLFGAYGPRIAAQLDHVVSELAADPYSRRATLTTWVPNPPKTKDTPCTVAMNFSIRRGFLNLHVFMRSSDLWLGIPYDVFSFSMVAYKVLCKLNDGLTSYAPGTLFLTAASSHLYEENVDAARSIVTRFMDTTLPAANALGLEPVREAFDKSRVAPPGLYVNEAQLLSTLSDIEESKAGDAVRWWEPLP